MKDSIQNSTLTFNDSVENYNITLKNNEKSVECNMNDTKTVNCSITSNLSIGNYSLFVVDSTDNSIIINIPNVINIYKIETVNIMNYSCIYRKASNFTKFASVLFDHKIKYSDINESFIEVSDEKKYNLNKNSIKKFENGTYEIGFSFPYNLSDFTEGKFFVSFVNSAPDDTNASFSLINTTLKDFNESIRFLNTSSNKIVINGTQNNKNGTISLLFSENITDDFISDLRAASIENVNFTKLNGEKRDGIYYIPYLVETDQTGYSQLKFEICGATFNTKPIKFIQNVTEENNFNLKFNKILFLIFILLF